MIKDYKITQWTNPIVNEADRPQRSASDMKAVFDGNSNQLKEAFNALIDALASGAGAGEIGAEVEGLEGNTVQSLLVALKSLCDRVDTSGDGSTFLASDGSYKLPEVGASANGVAAGGAAGDVYIKRSTTVYDGEWQSLEEAGIAPADHDHDEDYAALDHNHDEDYAALDHDHVGVYAAPSTALTVPLDVASWIGESAPYSITVNAAGVTADNHVMVAPAPASSADYGAAGVRCTGQAAGKLTFQCDKAPESTLSVNVLIVG